MRRETIIIKRGYSLDVMKYSYVRVFLIMDNTVFGSWSGRVEFFTS